MTGHVRVFTARLAQTRRDLGWSQQQLANRMHVSRSSLAKWESGRRTPELTALVAWASVLGFDLALIPKKENGKC